MTTVFQAAENFREEIARTRSRQTARTYRQALTAFVAHVNGSLTQTDTLTHKSFTGFFAEVLQREYAPSTSKLYGTCLRAFMRYLLRNDLLSLELRDMLKVEDATAATRQRQGRRLPRVPKDEDITAIRSAAWTSPLPSPLVERDIALIELLVCTGCRVSEIAQLRVGDIDLKHREAIVRGKGRKDRKVFLSPSAVNACSKYWLARGSRAPADPAFARHDDGAGKRMLAVTTQAIRNVVRKCAMVADVKLTPHSFRHYFATKMLRETNDLAITQDALGHSSPNTTRIYAHTDPETLRRAHREVWQ